MAGGVPRDGWEIGPNANATRDPEFIAKVNNAVSLMPAVAESPKYMHDDVTGSPYPTGWDSHALLYFEQGMELLENQDLHGAIDAFQKSVEIDPQNARALMKLGVALVDFGGLGEMNKGSDALRKAIELDPQNASAVEEASGAYLRLGIRLRNYLDQAEKASDALRKAIELDPQSSDAHYNLALLLEDKEEVDPAIASYRESIRLNPKCFPVHYDLANALENKGDLAGAKEAFEACLRLDPDDPDTLSRLAAVNTQMSTVTLARGGLTAAVFKRDLKRKLVSDETNETKKRKKMKSKTLKAKTLKAKKKSKKTAKKKMS